MMFGGNIRMALSALRASRLRSLLTMFGIIVGVLSVIITVSLGEGIKRQVLGQVNHLGSDLITVRPGNVVTRNKEGEITKVNLTSVYGFGSGSLSDADVDAVARTAGIQQSSPVGLLSSSASHDDLVYQDAFILGTNAAMPNLIKQKIAYGSYFNDGEMQRHVAIIGTRVAEQLFQQNVPIGMTLTIRGEEFIVRGVFDEFQSSPLTSGTDLNKAIFVPLPALKQASAGSTQIVQILARPSDKDQVNSAVKSITNNITASHNGQQDFTVLKQNENLAVTGNILDMLTTFIAGLAGLSLLVGGIGIMNIMLVSVTERTREIGIRKSVGATNRQIVNQFLTETTALSLVGGIIGVLLSFVVGFVISVTTDLQPVVTWPVVVIAVAASLLVGMLFGIVPAIKAARKDPIESLRFE